MERLGIHTESVKVQAITSPIEFDLAGQAGVKIDSFTNADGEAVYRLHWTDYVVNEWSEFYATLSLALARVAVLSACVEEDLKNDEVLSFKNDSATFAIHAYDFINKETN